MDSPCIKQTVCKVLKIFQCGKYLVAYVLKTEFKILLILHISWYMWPFAIKYIDISIKACIWQLPVLSYPHVLKKGGVNQSQEENSKQSDKHYFLIEVMPTLVKSHKTSFNVFSKHSNASWRHLSTKKGILAYNRLLILQFISNKNKSINFVLE